MQSDIDVSNNSKSPWRAPVLTIVAGGMAAEIDIHHEVSPLPTPIFLIVTKDFDFFLEYFANISWMKASNSSVDSK